eukprot:SAG11_NODE_8182_length_1051_cov_0.776261_1_plen_113_part_10
MGNAVCGSSVKAQLEGGELWLTLSDFPEGDAPVGDLASPFGADVVMPSVNRRVHYSNATGWHLYYVEVRCYHWAPRFCPRIAHSRGVGSDIAPPLISTIPVSVTQNWCDLDRS